MKIIKCNKRLYASCGDIKREIYPSRDNIEKLIMSHLLRVIDEPVTAEDFRKGKHFTHTSYAREK